MSTNSIPPSSVSTPEPSKSLFDKLGAALPIALTALATAFAGMSTSELQLAMFWRSYAAQDQAKATSQWTLAGFKRDRSLICQGTAAQLRAAASSPSSPKFEGASSQNSLASEWLNGNGPPPASLPEVSDASLAKLLADIQTRVPEAELLKEASRIPAAAINTQLDNAEKAVEELDKEWEPTLKAANTLVAEQTKNRAGAQAAGFELDQRRYRIESGLNQGLGFLYEARVKVSSAESEKHQRKSKYFFYAMLSAQIGATIASLALARKRKSLLWALAGCTGLVALGIGAVVYLVEV